MDSSLIGFERFGVKVLFCIINLLIDNKNKIC